MNPTIVPAGTRCDECPAKAIVRATMQNHHHVYFCGHHFAENKVVLELTALTINDTRPLATAAAR